MKKIFSLVLFVLLTVSTFGQISFSTGMGIDVVYTPTVQDYINFSFPDKENELKTFNKTLSIFGEIDYSISEKYQIGLEYNHTYFSHNSPLYNNYKLSYIIYKPTVIGYYVYPGNGYEFKFGAGIGYRYLSLEEKIYSAEEYTSSGVGILFKASGNTALGDNFYAYISADLRFDYLGEPDQDGRKIYNISNDEYINLNSFSAGIKLGVSYFIKWN